MTRRPEARELIGRSRKGGFVLHRPVSFVMDYWLSGQSDIYPTSIECLSSISRDVVRRTCELGPHARRVPI